MQNLELALSQIDDLIENIKELQSYNWSVANSVHNEMATILVQLTLLKANAVARSL